MTTTNSITVAVTDQNLLTTWGGAAQIADSQRIIGGQEGIGPKWT